ncbi:MAG TPA: polymer-forming cytoskeletal protein [Alphaproteobacteria bacterium]|nr:polymer-forming cytoskeletal protein [Alphaproteobacteria bacterium]
MFGRDKSESAKEPTGNNTGRFEAKPLPTRDSGSSLNLRKPLPARPHKPSTSRIADIPGMTPPRSEVRSYGVEGKTLVVGREISLNGQIAACDKLVVDGSVEADLEGCRQLEISPSGYFKGSAEIEEAEIAGRFDGRILAKKRLKVRATARIEGSVEYGQIEIEAGGEITGDLRLHMEKPKEAPVAPEAPISESSAATGT